MTCVDRWLVSPSDEGPGRAFAMNDAVAKRVLAHAATPQERTEAVEAAQHLGMPLCEIEEYLDWIDGLDLDDEDGRGHDEPISRDG